MNQVLGIEVVDYEAQILAIKSKRNLAIKLDALPIGVSLAANVAEAPRTWPGMLVAATAPIFLALAVWIWHLSHGVLDKWYHKLLFLPVLGAIAVACGVVSFNHIVSVAMAQGQTETAARAIAAIIDATAVLLALLVVACDSKMTALNDAAAAQQLQIEQFEAEQAEAERLQFEAEQAKVNANADEGVTRLVGDGGNGLREPQQRPGAVSGSSDDNGTLNLIEELTAPLNGNRRQARRVGSQAKPANDRTASTSASGVSMLDRSKRSTSGSAEDKVLELARSENRPSNAEIADTVEKSVNTVRRYLRQELQRVAKGEPDISAEDLAGKVGVTTAQAESTLKKLGKRWSKP